MAVSGLASSTCADVAGDARQQKGKTVPKLTLELQALPDQYTTSVHHTAYARFMRLGEHSIRGYRKEFRSTVLLSIQHATGLLP